MQLIVWIQPGAAEVWLVNISISSLSLATSLSSSSYCKLIPQRHYARRDTFRTLKRHGLMWNITPVISSNAIHDLNMNLLPTNLGDISLPCHAVRSHSPASSFRRSHGFFLRPLNCTLLLCFIIAFLQHKLKLGIYGCWSVLLWVKIIHRES